MLTGSRSYRHSQKLFRDTGYGMVQTSHALCDGRTINHALRTRAERFWSYFAFAATRARPNTELTIAFSTTISTSCCNFYFVYSMQMWQTLIVAISLEGLVVMIVGKQFNNRCSFTTKWGAHLCDYLVDVGFFEFLINVHRDQYRRNVTSTKPCVLDNNKWVC